MKIEIVWHEPVLLAKNKTVRSFQELRDSIPDGPGVYFFSRKYGDRFTPFYIGRTENLHTRLRAHLKSAKIQFMLHGDKKYNSLALAGNKFFHFGLIKSNSSVKTKKCLLIVEKYLIEKAIFDEIPLLNKSGTRIRAHEVNFSGSTPGRAVFAPHFAIRDTSR
jgi:hypothetical protein